tara:strand:+ start:124715 stop:125344 length:630 start_codon:yes stop_codon:yes gene_type:complete
MKAITSTLTDNIVKFTTALVFTIGATTASQAAIIDAPLPSNTFINLNGFDWAWGSNCARDEGSGCGTLDFGFQTTQGWRIAVATDMSLAPTALDFLFPGGNVPFGGTDPVSGASFGSTNAAYIDAASAGACASAYFTTGGAQTCDWINGSGQNVNTGGWFNQNGESNFFAEVLFIRDGTPGGGGGQVPVPATLALFGLGLLLMARRRRA